MADHNSLISVKLNEQVKCLDSLYALLNEELSIIASRRGEGLKELAQQKMSSLTKLTQLDKELNKLFAAIAYSPAQSGGSVDEAAPAVDVQNQSEEMIKHLIENGNNQTDI